MTLDFEETVVASSNATVRIHDLDNDEGQVDYGDSEDHRDFTDKDEWQKLYDPMVLDHKIMRSKNNEL